MKVLVARGPELLRELPALEVSFPVVGVTLAASVLSGLFFALLSSMRLGRSDVVQALKQGLRGPGGGPRRQRVRDGLMITQVALAIVLLVGSGLMVRSFRAMQAVDPGFDAPKELVTIRLGIPERTTPDPAEAALEHRTVLEALRSIPGVVSAGASTSVTMDGRDSHNSIHFEDFPAASGDLPPVYRVKFVAGGYAETMGIPVVAGRTLTWDDLDDRRRAVVVSEDLALRYWDEATDAVGRRLGFARGDWWEIVGVTGRVHDDGLHEQPVPVVYFPMIGRGSDGDVYAQRDMTHVLRVSEPSTLLPRIRETIWSVDRASRSRS